jgi:hypothetical protein
MAIDPTDPRTWHVGLLPILVSLASLYQYGLVILGIRELTSNRMYSIWGLSSGVALCAAWLLGYRSISELRVETIALFCAITTLSMITLGLLVIRKSEFGRVHFFNLTKLPRTAMVWRAILAFLVFAGVLSIGWLGEFFIDGPRSCTSLRCRSAMLWAGDMDSIFSALWFYSMIGGLPLSGAVYFLSLSVTARKTNQ